MVQYYYHKKVPTFKSGNFVFSRKYSNRMLQPYRIEAKILYETVKDLPVLPSLASDLEQELIRRSIFGTAAIEGNPLTEERVGQIIGESKDVDLRGNAEQEINNLKTAYDLFKGIKMGEPGKMPRLSEKVIKEVHKVITRKLKYEYNNPGNYRNHIVKVSNKEHGGIYTPPKCLPDIKKLMKEFMKWINSDELINLDAPIRAALAHYYLGLIHPFGDGNGRTARYIEAAILNQSGIKYVPPMLSNFYYTNIDDYFWAFSKTIKNKENDMTPFLEFVLIGFIESLKEIKERIVYFIRLFALRDLYAFLKKEKHITQRQNDLLSILLDKIIPFTLKDLYTETPFNFLYREVSERTARRDINVLKNMNLINTEDNKYILNLNALE